MSQSPKAFRQRCGISFPVVQIQDLEFRDEGTACNYTVRTWQPWGALAWLSLVPWLWTPVNHSGAKPREQSRSLMPPKRRWLCTGTKRPVLASEYWLPIWIWAIYLNTFYAFYMYNGIENDTPLHSQGLSTAVHTDRILNRKHCAHSRWSTDVCSFLPTSSSWSRLNVGIKIALVQMGDAWIPHHLYQPRVCEIKYQFNWRKIHYMYYCVFHIRICKLQLSKHEKNALSVKIPWSEYTTESTNTFFTVFRVRANAKHPCRIMLAHSVNTVGTSCNHISSPVNCAAFLVSTNRYYALGQLTNIMLHIN